MTASAHVLGGPEASLLDRLADRYEALGYTIVRNPAADLLPGFFGDYRPNAIATKAGANIAIDVRDARRTAPAERALAGLKALFVGHPDWRLEVIFSGGEMPLKIAAVQPEAIRNTLMEVETLTSNGNVRAAFLLAWSLLEASFHALGGEGGSKMEASGRVLQSLAMNGQVRSETELTLRDLMKLRNRVAHGDLGVAVAPEDVEAVVMATREALHAIAA